MRCGEVAGVRIGGDINLRISGRPPLQILSTFPRTLLTVRRVRSNTQDRIIPAFGHD